MMQYWAVHVIEMHSFTLYIIFIPQRKALHSYMYLHKESMLM